jgi:hypothetical protein
MATTSTGPRKVRVKLEPDDYLTDGTRLARVYEVEGEYLVLEDARTGETERLPVDKLGDWTLVRRSKDSKEAA